MSESGAYEVLHKDKVHRAASMEVVLRWAREGRISNDDSLRKAGSDRWVSVFENSKLAAILDPANWWSVRIENKEYKAPSFEIVVEWTREGRLSTDTIIEGPKTPPGGVLASGLPGLAPFLREPVRYEPGEEPPRLRIDGREYLPGDLDTVREWISGSRVPLEAEISLDGGSWEPVSECGLFELELWPEGAHGDHIDEERPPVDTAKPLRIKTDKTDKSAEVEPEPTDTVPEEKKTTEEEKATEEESISSEPWLIVALGGDYKITDPMEIFGLLDRRKIHSFDEVRHPDLPDGACSVAKMIEIFDLRKQKSLWWVWAITVILLLIAVVVFFKPFQ